MSEEEFPVIVAALVTSQRDVLIGKKESGENPVSEQWHLPGGHLEEDEDLREAVKREISEETDLDVEIHHIVDVYKGEIGAVRIIFHCEASDRDIDAGDDLVDIKWVSPENLEEELGDYDSEIVSERDNIRNFVEKLQKMPSF